MFLICCVDVMVSYTKNKPFVSQEILLKLQKLTVIFKNLPPLQRFLIFWIACNAKMPSVGLLEIHKSPLL